MKKNRLLKLLFIFVITVLLTGCSCGCGCQPKYMSVSDIDNEIKETISLEENDVSQRKEKTVSYILGLVSKTRTNFINTYIEGEVTGTFDISADLTQIEKISEVSVKASEKLVGELNNLKNSCTLKSGEFEESITDYITRVSSKVEKASLIDDVYYTSKSIVEKIVDTTDYKDYQIELFNTHKHEADLELDNLYNQVVLNAETYDADLVKNAQALKDVVVKLQAQIVEDVAQPEPIRFQLNSVGDFFTYFFDNFFIYPVGWLLYALTKLCGNIYVIGLIITTLLIRTIAWPVYAKSNDMTLKMKLMEPEQAKIQEKYARRQDPESQKMMQMELMQLYKKYGVGIGGCLMPFIQLPIFLAVFRAVTRLPYTNGFAGSPDWVSGMNHYVFGIDLFADKSSGGWQLWGIIILCVLVGVTQVLQTVLMNLRNKKQQEEAQKDVPAYRRQAVAQSQQNSSMKIFMWVMVAMMVVFVFTSKAGLGIYWLIGNLYALFQSFVGSKTSEKRLEHLKNKANKK